MAKDAAKGDQLEVFLRAPLHPPYDSCLITEHSYGGGVSLELIPVRGQSPPTLSTFPVGGNRVPGENPRLSAER